MKHSPKRIKIERQIKWFINRLSRDQAGQMTLVNLDPIELKEIRKFCHNSTC